MAKSKQEPNGAIQQLYQARQLALRGVLPTDDAFREQYPLIWELLVSTWVDDKHRIEPARLEIQAVSGDWFFKLSQPTLRGHKQVSVKAYADGLAVLERAIPDPNVPWTWWLKRKVKLSEAEKSRSELPKLET